MGGTAWTPVIVGVGALHQRLSEPGVGLDDTAMIVEAAREAVFDSGARSTVSHVTWIGASRGLAGLPDVAREVARAFGIEAHTVAAAVGVPQQTLISRALSGIRSGQIEAAIICGGEAKWRSDLARRSGVSLPERRTNECHPDETLSLRAEVDSGPELAIGADVPVQQYAMIENARRAANEWTMAQHLDDISNLWKRFNVVAGTNSAAAFPHRRSAESIRQAGPENRMLAFPYNEWHTSQRSVDQAAALLVCSTEVAKRCRVSRDRWVYPHVSLESSHSLALSRRRDLNRWPAMEVLGRASEKRTGLRLRELRYMELYSCFPAAVRVQQDEFGLPSSGTPTITGGMTFAGGPFNSFVYQSTVAMASTLRSHPGTFGVVTGVNGPLTKPTLSIWSTQPPPESVLIDDMVVEVAAVTHEASLDETPNGRGTVATYTVVPSDDIASTVVAIVDLDDGARAVAKVDDRDLAASAMVEEFIGRRVNVDGIHFST